MNRSNAGESSNRPGAVRVMGTPRSGTNLAKHLIQSHLGVRVVFDQGFWKHGVFPALMEGRSLGHGDLPIVVMSKNPVSQLLSWFRYARNDSLFRPETRLSAFLCKPLEIRQDFTKPGRMAYRFRTPADYWNQFYFAMHALRSAGVPVLFVGYEQLASEPAATLASIARFLDLSPPFDADAVVSMPAHVLTASNDVDPPGAPTADRAPFDPRKVELATALKRMGWRNARRVLRDIDEDVLEATGRPEFRSTCRDTIGRAAILRSYIGLR
jgi:hypothetical protein